jgi:hypothetical protein
MGGSVSSVHNARLEEVSEEIVVTKWIHIRKDDDGSQMVNRNITHVESFHLSSM